jgi:hypothetical protein
MSEVRDIGGKRHEVAISPGGWGRDRLADLVDQRIEARAGWLVALRAR